MAISILVAIVDNRLKTLGARIAAERVKAGFASQTAFAEALGVKQGTVSSWETGDINLPYLTLCQIAERLNISPARIVDPAVPIAKSTLAERNEAAKLVLDLGDDDTLDSVLRLLRGSAPAAGKKGKATSS